MSMDARSAWAESTRVLFLVAMAVFVVTVSIGIPNGLDVFEPDRNTVLTHVHSGTLGWITLTVVAAAGWLLGGIDRRLAIALAVMVPVYVAAFYTGNFALRAITGVLLLAVIGWLLVWAWQAYQRGERTLPRLAIVVGLSVFAAGSLLGVILQIGFAMGTLILPGDGVGAHASTMVFGYVVVSAMAVIEWIVRGTRDLPRSGLAQLGLLVLGATILMLGLLTGATEAAGGAYLLTALLGVLVFGVRILPVALRTDWLRAGTGRAGAIASLWIVVALILYMYIVTQFIQAQGDITKVNLGALVASDHAAFIGVITNLMFALVARFAAARAALWAWADQVVFWAMNGGLAVFVIGLVLNLAEVKRIGAPVMGVAILLGLAVLAARLWGTRPADAEASEAVAAA
jgi:hypothetical protein